ncbi:hypothetical protein [Butyrivibrio sp. INlla21]|uniref:hypothetical protein n=1 Tax=Butyrivibrio sp. INlla21 TaxID=1520811 RepID=UPI0008F0D343|nr:hypothetical protein [Butyrivibrio sp. INlla21]SFU42342.1 hypothetical protein SAMN02910342_00441 [Butyrivibrio sp. INlla21]
MKVKRLIVSVLALSMLFCMPVMAHGKSHHHHHHHKTADAAVTDAASTDDSSTEDVSTENASTEASSTEAVSTDAASTENSTEVAATAVSSAEETATASSSEATEEQISPYLKAMESINKGFTLGEVKGNVYENSYFNVKVTIPEDLQYNDTGFKTQVDYLTNAIIPESAAVAHVQVTTKNGKPVQLLNADNGRDTLFDVHIGYVADNTDDIYNEKALIESQLGNIVDMFTNMQLTDVKTSVNTISFLGEEHPAMLVTGSLLGVPYTHQYVCIPKDGYVLIIGFGGFERTDFSPITEATKFK